MYDVATIQTQINNFVKRAIVAPRTDDGTVLLDSCPAGTTDVRSFPTAKAAAAYMGVSTSTVYRQMNAAE